MKNRSIIRTTHVDFDNIINPSKIKKNNDKFDYVTLDFSRSSKEDLTTHETINILPSDEVDSAEELMRVNNDEVDKNVKSDKESVFPESRDKGLV